MARKDEKRVRSKTVSFYVTPEEHAEIQARIKVTGMPKGEYFIQSLLHQKISISVGKYRSDRLALELKKLREALELTSDTDGIVDECRALLSQLQEVITDNQELTVEDFASSKGAKV